MALTKRIFNNTNNTHTPYQASYTVLGYEWFSHHNMYFALHDGGKVRISDGNAWCVCTCFNMSLSTHPLSTNALEPPTHVRASVSLAPPGTSNRRRMLMATP